MARYTVAIRTDRTPEQAFDYLADLRNFADWDPGVVESTLIEGDEPGLGSVFRVVVKAVGGPMALDYRMQRFDRPLVAVATAANRWLGSDDTITVRIDGDGCIVTYDAVLSLKGPLRLADPLLSLAFGRIGDRAAAGLIAALEGERVSAAAAG